MTTLKFILSQIGASRDIIQKPETEEEVIKARHRKNIRDNYRLAFMNLFIALSASGLVILMLWYVYKSYQPVNLNAGKVWTWADIQVYFLKRWEIMCASLALDAIAIFFFREYRKCCRDRKYYQCKMADIEMTILALHQAKELGDKELVRTITLSLLKPEPLQDASI